jgi:hypothetical protein
MMKLNSEIAKILEPAYNPCPGFSGVCGATMRWAPDTGHVPRGFRGASGTLDEIELVLIYAEPGNPLPGERHTGLESAYLYSTRAFETGATQFHVNVKAIINSCWPNLSFEEQMRKVWMTESVLCSAPIEGGRISAPVCRECGSRYLLQQLALLPNALVVALGSKARDRLRMIGVNNFLEVKSVAPPGCNHRGARESWAKISETLNAGQ